MLEKYLQEIGLSDKESTTYITLLQVDNASVLDISKKTKLNRSTTYVILESLAKKGLVSETTIGKKTHYQAEPPERLKTYVERRKIEFQEMEKRLDDIIPQIKGIARESGERPVVKYFEGKEGIISAMDETMRARIDDGEPMYFVYSRDLIEELFPKTEHDKFRERRISRKIKSKAIYVYEKGELSSDEMGERFKIDGKKYPITCDVAIYKDTVRISVLGGRLSSIFIRSQDVANTFKSIFQIAFDKLKEGK